MHTVFEMALETLNKLLGASVTSGVPNSSPETETEISVVHPLNNPETWLKSPAYIAPVEVNIEREQKAVDSIIGTTRENQPIIKVVWAGDREFWKEFFMSWDSSGKPNAAPVKRPLVRYGTVRNDKGEFVRDVFPARWLLLARVEPEQYAATYKQSCFMFAPEIGGLKQIQPEAIPSVMWILFAIVGHHSDYCCGTAAKNKKKCFGQYAPPSYYLTELGEQKRACEKSGFKSHNPFEQIDAETIRLAENENTGYLEDIARLKVKQQIFMDNPMALLGLLPTMNGDFDSGKGKQMVKDYFDRKIEERQKLIK